MTTIELVRHAKAESRDRWWGKPDRERPLTEDGWEQSRLLAHQILADGPLAGLYSSPFTRCTQTLAPLAQKTGLPIIPEDVLGEATRLPVLDGGDAWVASAWLGGRAIALVNRVVAQHRDERVVLCSHGDVIPALLAVLTGRDALHLSDVRLRKGARVSLRFEGTRCASASRVPPPLEAIESHPDD